MSGKQKCILPQILNIQLLYFIYGDILRFINSTRSSLNKGNISRFVKHYQTSEIQMSFILTLQQNINILCANCIKTSEKYEIFFFRIYFVGPP